MFDIFSKKENHLGLDLSDVSLKMIQLSEKRRAKNPVRAYSDVDIPKDAVTGEMISKPKELIKKIREAVSAPQFGQVTTSKVVASIPETKTFIRVIDMPRMTEAEASEAVPWEAEAYIPMPIGQVYLDWFIIDPLRDPNAKTMKVFLSASPRDYIDQFTEILIKAGLDPLAMEVESQATARSLISRQDLDKTVLVIDISTERTSFIIFDQGTLHFTSSVPVAGSLLTQKVADALTLDWTEAEQLKKKIGLDENEKNATVRRAMMPVLNNLVEEIRNTIRFYEEHSVEGAKIEKILLTGGSSKMKRLPAFINDQLVLAEESGEHTLRSIPGVNIQRGDPWINILGKKDPRPMNEADSLSFSTAIGLVLREEK